MAAPAAYGRSQDHIQIRAAAEAHSTATATLDPSLSCDLCHSLWQPQIFCPLSKARDWTQVLMDTKRFLTHGDAKRTPELFLNCFFFFSLFFSHTLGIWKFLHQGWNLSCSCNLCHSCDNAMFLTPVPQEELQMLSFNFFLINVFPCLKIDFVVSAFVYFWLWTLSNTQPNVN